MWGIRGLWCLIRLGKAEGRQGGGCLGALGSGEVLRIAVHLLAGRVSAQHAEGVLWQEFGGGVGRRLVEGEVGILGGAGAGVCEEVGVGGAGVSLRLGVSLFPCVECGGADADRVGYCISGEGETGTQTAAFGGRRQRTARGEEGVDRGISAHRLFFLDMAGGGK